MPRLPTPGGDIDTWGGILNDYLGVAHEADGSLRPLTKHPVNVLDYGTDGAAVRAALDDPARAGRPVYAPEGIYDFSAVLAVTANNVALLGDGPDRTIFRKAASTQMLNVGGLDRRVTTEANTLAANASAGATSVTLAAGKGANIAAGTWVLLVSNDLAPGTGHTQKRAEFVFVESKATDTLTLAAPLKFTYTTTAAAEVQRINWVEGLRIEGIGFDGADILGAGGVNAENVAHLMWCLEPEIHNVKGWDLPNWFIGLQGCLNARLSGIRARDQLSDGVNGNTGSFGYTVVELGLNEGLICDGLHAERTRHAYTTAGGLGLDYGIPMGSRIANGVATAMRGFAWDTHPVGLDIAFDNCVALGSLGGGFQTRSIGTRFIGGDARDCVGPALYPAANALRTEVQAFKASRTNLGTYAGAAWENRGAIYDNGARTLIAGARIDSCGGPAASLGADATFPDWRDIEALDPCQITTTNKFGFEVPSTATATRWRARGCQAEDTTAKMTNGFRVAHTTMEAEIRDSRVLGASSLPYSFAGTNVTVVGGYGSLARASGRWVDVTLAADAMNVDGLGSALLNVRGEVAAASDSLVTINGGVDGQEIVLRRGDAAITVNHGVGNIQLHGAVNFALDSTYDNLTLRKIGGTWFAAGPGMAN